MNIHHSQTIWHSLDISLDALNEMSENTMTQLLGIEFTGIGRDYIRAMMPVDARTRQPYGLLHGGASVALAETLGSVASALVIDTTSQQCVGLEINANHLRAVRKGFVHGIASPLHIGKSTHVWEIKIQDDEERLICISRLTVAILSLSDKDIRGKK